MEWQRNNGNFFYTCEKCIFRFTRTFGAVRAACSYEILHSHFKHFSITIRHIHLCVRVCLGHQNCPTLGVRTY